MSTAAKPLYQKLREGRQETRFLVLLPSSDELAPIHGTLEVGDLEHPPEYEAISWFWGDASITENILLSGVEKAVPRNLFEALTHFRYHDRSRILWTDGVSINQADLREREYQITLMGEIYRKARATVVWLGPMMAADDRVIMETFHRLSEGFSLRQIVLERVGLCDSNILYKADELNALFDEESPETLERAGLRVLIGLSRFFQLSWWRRLWVLQEFALATTVQIVWGDCTINMAKLTLAIDQLSIELREFRIKILNFSSGRFLEDLESDIRWSTGSAVDIQKLYEENQSLSYETTLRQSCFKLIEVLGAGSSRSATDERDKVYGLLGLFPDRMVQIVAPSYSLAPLLVFTEMAYRVLDTTHSFLIFSCLEYFVKDEAGPGWVPRWTWNLRAKHLRCRIEQHQLFRACDAEEWSLSRPSVNIIRVTGARLDLISERFQSKETVDTLDVYQCLDEWKRFLFFTQYPQLIGILSLDNLRNVNYVTGVSLLETLFRTLLEDCEPLKPARTVGRLSRESYNAITTWFLANEVDLRLHGSTLDFTGLFDQVDWLSMLEHISSVTGNTELLVTTLGYIALTKMGIELKYGECELWILAGGSHPVILKPVEGRPACYYTCGEAYVHGVMDGEAVRGECPVFPEDGDVDKVWKDINGGRKSWPVPTFTDIFLV